MSRMELNAASGLIALSGLAARFARRDDRRGKGAAMAGSMGSPTPFSSSGERHDKGWPEARGMELSWPFAPTPSGSSGERANKGPAETGSMGSPGLFVSSDERVDKEMAKTGGMASPALSVSSDEAFSSGEQYAETLTDIASYVADLRDELCQSVESPSAKSPIYRCTWGCPFSTDSPERWLQHESDKQTLQLWHCAICRVLRRSDPGRPAYITHLKRDMLSHARSHHDLTREDSDELVHLSAMLWERPAPRECTFTLDGRRACDRNLQTWQERHGHYILHFDWWWDRILLEQDQQRHHRREAIELSNAQAIRLDSLSAMSVQPRLAPQVEETLDSRIIATANTDEQSYESAAHHVKELIRQQIRTVADDIVDAACHRLSRETMSSLDLRKIRVRPSETLLLLQQTVTLIQSRGGPSRDLRKVIDGVLEIIIYREIDRQLHAIEAIGTSSGSQSAVMNDMVKWDAAHVLSSHWRPHAPQNSRDFERSQYSDPADDREYSWLLSVAEQPGATAFSSSNSSCNLLRRRFMVSLQRQMLCDPDEVYNLRAKLDWSPLCVVSDDSAETAAKTTLADVITLTGHFLEGYASTCAEYVKCMWPNFGHITIRCMQNAASSDLGTSTISEREVQLVIDCTSTRTFIDASGPSVALLEIFECAAWLGAACRPSPEPHGISATNTVPHSGYGGFLSFDVTYTCLATGLHDDHIHNATCWRYMFRNPVLATGFPVPSREADEQGLEMSLPLLTTLGQTFWATNFNGLLLKGFNSIAIPVKRIGNSVLWHFQVNEDGGRMSYTDADQTRPFRCYEDAMFSRARHFVGWTHSESIAGTKAVDYTVMEESTSKAVGSGICMDSMLALQAGQYVNVGINIHRGTKDRPERLSWDLYERQIDSASRWGVVLSDTRKDCHYLVDGATAVLHLSLAWLLSGHVRYAPTGLLDKMRIPAASSSETVFRTLLDPENRKVELLWSESSQAWWRFENLAQEYFHIIEQINDRFSIRNTSEIQIGIRKRELIGFDIMDLLLESGPVFPRRRRLRPGAKDWLALTLKLKTINILGSNLGDLIKPMPLDQSATSTCRLRDTFPHGQDYLGVSLPTVKSIIGRHREHTDFALHLADSTYLSNPWSYFANCVCKQTSLSQCTHLVKKLASARGPAGTVSRTHRIFEAYSHGALIFGSRGSRFKSIVMRDRHKEDYNLSTPRSRSSNSKATRAKRPSSDSGVDVHCTDISSSYPSQQSNLDRTAPRPERTIERAARRFWKRR